MQRKDPDVDIVMNVLKAAELAYPASAFIKSLLFQYQERGGLSKKQLEGLHSKASKIKTLPPNLLVTLEAEILKRPTRFKSLPPAPKPALEKDERPGQLIEGILNKYPAHKRVLLFKLKYDKDGLLTAAEIAELEKFSKLLL
jgi:hypothetical protein